MLTGDRFRVINGWSSLVQCMFGAYSFYSPNRGSWTYFQIAVGTRLVIMEIVSIAHVHYVKDLIVAHLMWTRHQGAGRRLGRHIAMECFHTCTSLHVQLMDVGHITWGTFLNIHGKTCLTTFTFSQAGHARWSNVTLMGVSQSGEPLHASYSFLYGACSNLYRDRHCSEYPWQYMSYNVPIRADECPSSGPQG